MPDRRPPIIAEGTLGSTLGQILIPMITPFRENGDLNGDYAASLADHLITNGLCDSLVVTGTTGEFNTLSFDERVSVMETVAETNRGRVPLVAGTGAASTREAIALSRIAEKAGYNALMVVAPYYCRPTQEGIYRHYVAIAESVRVPVMLYNIPLFTGVNVAPETVARLAQIPNISGIKDEAGINPTQMTEYRNAVDGDFTIYNGDDIMILCGLVQGAAGVVSGCAHVLGPQIRGMIDSFLSGDLQAAHAIHLSLDPFFKALCPNGRINPMPVLRAALEEAGLPVGPPRLPLDTATPDERATIRGHLERLGVV